MRLRLLLRLRLLSKRLLLLLELQLFRGLRHLCLLFHLPAPLPLSVGALPLVLDVAQALTLLIARLLGGFAVRDLPRVLHDLLALSRSGRGWRGWRRLFRSAPDSGFRRL